MLGWMDDEALARTLTTGRATYWSRSRQEYWVKGETSGHRPAGPEVRLDCDGDTLLVKVDQEGPACHTGDRTCFDADLLLVPEPATDRPPTGAVPSARSSLRRAAPRGLGRAWPATEPWVDGGPTPAPGGARRAARRGRRPARCRSPRR